MTTDLPKEYTAAVFEAKGQPLVFKKFKLELPQAGEVGEMPDDM